MKTLFLRLSRFVAQVVPRGKTAAIELALFLFGNKFSDTIQIRDGRKFFIKEIKQIHRELFFLGTYEEQITRTIQNIIKPGDYAFDFGANFGWFTTLLSPLVKNGRVFAFEISDEICEELRKNVQINHMTNVTIETLAIGDSEKSVPYFYFSDNGLANLDQNILPNADVAKTVNMTTLDHYIEEKNIERLDFIKCDIDGAEVLFLRGARKSIAKFKPVIVIEAVDWILNKFGFTANSIPEELSGYAFFSIEEGFRQLTSLPSNFSGNLLCIPKEK